MKRESFKKIFGDDRWCEEICHRLGDVIAIFDLNLDFVFIGNSVEKILGYKSEELIGENVKKVLTEKSYNDLLKLFEQELEKEKDPLVDKDRTVLFLAEEVTKKGEKLFIEVNASALRNKNGEIEYILTVNRDVTERVILQRSLEESEKRFRIIFNSTNDAIFIHDAITGTVIDVNDTMLNMYGYDDKKDVIGRDVSFFSDDDYSYDRAFSLIQQARGGKTKVFEWKAKKKNGSIFWVEVALTGTHFKDREIVVAVVRDITSRKRLENKLMEQVELFRTLSKVSTTSIGIFDGDKFLYVNRAVEEITGYTREEILKNPFYFCVHPQYRDLVINTVRSRLKDGGKNVPSKYEIKIITKHGKEKWVELAGGKVYYKEKPAIVGTAYDISHLKETQLLLTCEKKKLSAILKNVEEGILTTDTEGVITYINEAASRMLGVNREDVVGKLFDSVFKFEDSNTLIPVENPLMSCIRNEQPIEIYEVFIHALKNGIKVPIELMICPIRNGQNSVMGSVVVIRDIRKKQMFLQSVQNSQKLKAIATLAAGIAHGFNNLLAGIYGFINLALFKAKDESISNYLKKALTTLEEARSLTGHLLTFTEGGEPTREEQSLHRFLKDTVNLTLKGSKVKANFDLDEDLICSFDKNHLLQAIGNIIINALEEMRYRGEIDVGLKRVNISEFNNMNLPSGEYAEIRIRDRGKGIPKKILDHIFEPFFTTKHRAHGLGLTTSYSIVKRHGGDILVESKEGEGTTFFIYLPVVDKKVSTSYEDVFCIENVSCKGTIVVLDDEDFILEIMEDTLKEFGFNVVLKKSGEELIDFIENADDDVKSDIKAIFFDIIISGKMDGLETANKIKDLIDVPFIVMSGYASDPVMSRPQDYGFVATLKKPFRIKELEEIIKNYVL